VAQHDEVYIAPHINSLLASLEITMLQQENERTKNEYRELYRMEILESCNVTMQQVTSSWLQTRRRFTRVARADEALCRSQCVARIEVVQDECRTKCEARVEKANSNCESTTKKMDGEKKLEDDLDTNIVPGELWDIYSCHGFAQTTTEKPREPKLWDIKSRQGFSLSHSLSNWMNVRHTYTLTHKHT